MCRDKSTYGLRQKELLQAALGNDYTVEMAMRYQSPSIEKTIQKFKYKGFKKLIIFPLFPQYASASSGSVVEKVMDVIRKWEVFPEIKFMKSFCDDDDFIKAFSACGRKYNHAAYDKVLFSFHGLPERQILKAHNHNHCLKSDCCSILNEKNAFCFNRIYFHPSIMRSTSQTNCGSW